MTFPAKSLTTPSFFLRSAMYSAQDPGAAAPHCHGLGGGGGMVVGVRREKVHAHERRRTSTQAQLNGTATWSGPPTCTKRAGGGKRAHTSLFGRWDFQRVNHKAATAGVALPLLDISR